MLFGMPIEEAVAALTGYATLLGMVAGVFVRAGRILQKLEDHERRLKNLERASFGRIVPGE